MIIMKRIILSMTKLFLKEEKMNDNKISARIYRLPVDSSKLDTAVDNCSNDVVLVPLRANEIDNKLCSGCVARYMTLDGKYFDMSLSVAQWEAYYDCAIPEISKIIGDIMNYDEKLRHRIIDYYIAYYKL